MNKEISNYFESIQPLIFECLENMKLIIDKTPESLYGLSRYGWYIDMGFDVWAPIELNEIIQIGDITILDNYMCKYLTDKLELIEEDLCCTYINRKQIFKEAFNCFRQNQYFASITLFLSQVDGICYDRTDKLFFLNNKKLKRKGVYIPEVEEEISKLSGGLSDIYLEPIKYTSLINDDTRNVDKYPVKLNRHAILHGLETEYGTRINCLKVISLVNYLNEMLTK